jgi:hypothetical protein
MAIKTIKANIAEVQGRLWRNRQYLALTQKQLALIYRATPATSHRSRAQLRALQAAMNRDSRTLAALNQALQAAIDGQASPQIKELLTRRYINDEPFTAIAAAMGYDLRWVYRLHARGLAEAGPSPDQGEHG